MTLLCCLAQAIKFRQKRGGQTSLGFVVLSIRNEQSPGPQDHREKMDSQRLAKVLLAKSGKGMLEKYQQYHHKTEQSPACWGSVLSF